ncbi:hypothetical protein L1887_22309 [Cichorium endivia]|nr:hypothetical protein L1887_22309 [Cichorium endivia]
MVTVASSIGGRKPVTKQSICSKKHLDSSYTCTDFPLLNEHFTSRVPTFEHPRSPSGDAPIQSKLSSEYVANPNELTSRPVIVLYFSMAVDSFKTPHSMACLEASGTFDSVFRGKTFSCQSSDLHLPSISQSSAEKC